MSGSKALKKEAKKVFTEVWEKRQLQNAVLVTKQAQVFQEARSGLGKEVLDKDLLVSKANIIRLLQGNVGNETLQELSSFEGALFATAVKRSILEKSAVLPEAVESLIFAQIEKLHHTLELKKELENEPTFRYYYRMQKGLAEVNGFLFRMVPRIEALIDESGRELYSRIIEALKTYFKAHLIAKGHEGSYALSIDELASACAKDRAEIYEHFQQSQYVKIVVNGLLRTAVKAIVDKLKGVMEWQDERELVLEDSAGESLNIERTSSETMDMTRCARAIEDVKRFQEAVHPENLKKVVYKILFQKLEI